MEDYTGVAPLANNHLENFVVEEGAEVVMSEPSDFMMYCLHNKQMDKMLYGERDGRMGESWPLTTEMIDYDPSTTRINQEDRIKLMLANAQYYKKKQKNNMNKKIVTFVLK